MAQNPMVTLEHPDGRRIRTDSATEINTLTGSYGYRRVDDEQSSQPQQKQSRQARQQSKPAHEPDTNPVPPQTRTDNAGSDT